MSPMGCFIREAVVTSINITFLLQSTQRLSPVTAELAAKVERGLSAAGESLPRKSVFRECKK